MLAELRFEEELRALGLELVLRFEPDVLRDLEAAALFGFAAEELLGFDAEELFGFDAALLFDLEAAVFGFDAALLFGFEPAVLFGRLADAPFEELRLCCPLRDVVDLLVAIFNSPHHCRGRPCPHTGRLPGRMPR